MEQGVNDYIGFDKPEVLEIEFDGPPLDAYTLAHLNFTLHSISNKVALIDRRYFPEFIPARFLRRYPFRYGAEAQIVRLRVDKIGSGSLLEIGTFLVAAIFSDDAARAILQGLATNIIWAISASGLRGIRSKHKEEALKELPAPDPFDIGPELGETIRHLSNISRGKRCKLRFHATRPDGETSEVEIDING